MRLFVALTFPDQVRQDFLRIQSQLKHCTQQGRFPPAEQFHLTLSFLGEVEASQLPAVFAAQKAAPMGPFQLSFDRLSSFPGGIWCLFPRPCPALMEGQSRLDTALRAHGFCPEDRPYVPHVTLGRKLIFREGTAPDQALARPIPAQAEGPYLFLSHRVEGQLRYEILTP